MTIRTAGLQQRNMNGATSSRTVRDQSPFRESMGYVSSRGVLPAHNALLDSIPVSHLLLVHHGIRGPPERYQPLTLVPQLRHVACTNLAGIVTRDPMLIDPSMKRDDAERSCHI